MFKVSTKGDYGLLILSALAEHQKAGQSYVSLKEIAEEKKLSLSYISQIISPLKEAGLVKSKEGRDGGYRLSKSPEKITMMEVLEILEGPVSPVRCCSNAQDECGSKAACGTQSTWKDAQHLLMNFLRKRTIADTLQKKSPSIIPLS